MRIMYSDFGNISVLEVAKVKARDNSLTFIPINDNFPRVMIVVNSEIIRDIATRLLREGFADLSSFSGSTTILY